MEDVKIEQVLKGDELAIATVQEGVEEDLIGKQNVVGVGVGKKIKDGVEKDDPVISVFVTHKLPKNLISKSDMIPTQMDKIATDVVETGEIFAGCADPDEEVALESEEADILSLKKRIRPVEGGYSVGHWRITAGTYATAAYDSAYFPGIPPRYYVLSNNHVLANSNACKIGDPILQPGPYDGGRYPADMIARLSRFVPIKFGGPANYVDAAIAEGPFHYLDREIYWIGYVKGLTTVTLRQPCQKTGRTTNYTTGRVTALNATVNVNYGGGKVAKMVRQIVTTNMSAGGDSGSLGLDMNERAFGLLFAGSSTHTIYNDIRYVCALLRIRLT